MYNHYNHNHSYVSIIIIVIINIYIITDIVIIIKIIITIISTIINNIFISDYYQLLGAKKRTKTISKTNAPIKERESGAKTFQRSLRY